MTMYVGEELKLTMAASDFDNETALTQDDAEEVTITIFDKDAVEVVAETDMLWHTTDQIFYYMWDTTGLDPGTYRAKCKFVGLDGKPSWEYKRVRLSRNPV